MHWKLSPLVNGTLLGGSRNFRGWNLVGGSTSLGLGLAFRSQKGLGEKMSSAIHFPHLDALQKHMGQLWTET